MSKLSFMTDMKFFATKPKGKDVMEFQNNNVSTQMELCELASSLANGMTFKPAVLSGKSSDTWLSQQLFALDFDGAATFDEVEALFSFAKPAFGYTTYSHTEENHRFRLVFVLEHPVTDVRLRNMIQHSLMTIYKMCDKKAKDPTRLFFGGTRLIFEDYQSRICPHDVMVHAICRDETNYTKNMKSFCKKLELKVDDGRPSVELIESQESNDPEAVVYRSNNKIFRFNFVSQKQGKQVILKKKKNKVILKKKKDDSAKINNFDFDELYEKCQLYQDVIDGSHWAYHDELFGLACNLVQVSGGEKRLRQIINELDCYEDKRKSFNNMISYIKKTNYSPMRCENFCPHFKNNCSNKGLNMFVFVN